MAAARVSTTPVAWGRSIIHLHSRGPSSKFAAGIFALRRSLHASVCAKAKMAPSNVKLTYFDGRGRAELPRLLLAYGNVKYEDVRLSEEEFGKLKPSLPYGELPLLEWGGDKIAQTLAITRLIANEVGLAGKDALENAKIDQVGDHSQDHINSAIEIALAEDDARKQATSDKFLEKAAKFVADAEKILKANGGKYFVGDKLTWADVSIAERVWALSDKEDPFYCKLVGSHLDQAKRVSLAAEHKVLLDHAKMVKEAKGIKDWLKSRPESTKEEF